MNRIAIVQFVRLASRRVPQKLLEVVGGQRLVDRGFSYLHQLGETTGAVPIVAVQPRDVPLIEAAGKHGLRLLLLDDRAERAAIWPGLIAPFAEQLRREFDVVWDANVCCRPFLRQATGEFIIRQCRELERPFVAVTRKRGVVWTENSPTPVLGAGALADTQRNPHYFELAHLAYCWPSSMLLLSERELAENVQPLEIRLDWAERIDIDTPADLKHARAVAEMIEIPKRPCNFQERRDDR